MAKLEELKTYLKRGEVYRRGELAVFSKSIDRQLSKLVKDGTLRKLSSGLYHYPKVSVLGEVPPEEAVLVRCFLRDKHFLLTSPNLFNAIGIGTTQLYNQRIVYNHKRHGRFAFGNRCFDFQVKRAFPDKLSPEFLLVDLAGQIERLAEDHQQIRNNLLAKAGRMNQAALRKVLDRYGNRKAKHLLGKVLL